MAASFRVIVFEPARIWLNGRKHTLDCAHYYIIFFAECHIAGQDMDADVGPVSKWSQSYPAGTERCRCVQGVV